jgi:hypothetical protein
VWYAYHRWYATEFKEYAAENKLLKMVPGFYLLSDILQYEEN